MLPDQKVEFAHTHTLLAGEAIAEGSYVKYGADDETVVNAQPGDIYALGPAEQTVLPGQEITFHVEGIIKPIQLAPAGTGAVRGHFLELVAGGYQTAPDPAANGATLHFIHGQAVRDGNPGDIIGMIFSKRIYGA
jgi:hypothetical protein